MPSRNAVKQFEPETMYHVYNRGVDSRKIFTDEYDYTVFLSFLKHALLPEDKVKQVISKEKLSNAKRFNPRRINLSQELELVAFCLMPTHFHLLLYQVTDDAITRFMRSTATGYSMYFNKRQHRKGTLLQGRYKASEIDSQAYWLHISRYIHLNPLDIRSDYLHYDKSSLRYYLGETKVEWLKPQRVLENFDSVDEYKRFVADYESRRSEFKELEKELGL